MAVKYNRKKGKGTGDDKPTYEKRDYKKLKKFANMTWKCAKTIGHGTWVVIRYPWKATHEIQHKGKRLAISTALYLLPLTFTWNALSPMANILASDKRKAIESTTVLPEQNNVMPNIFKPNSFKEKMSLEQELMINKVFVKFYTITPRTAKEMLDLVGLFEGSGNVGGNFDGQGLSMGLLSYNLGQGTLQDPLNDMLTKHSELMKKIFGKEKVQELNRVMKLPKDQQVQWGASITISTKSGKVKPEWEKPFMEMMTTSEWTYYNYFYAKPYLETALLICKKYNIQSKAGLLQVLSACVQLGRYHLDPERILILRQDKIDDEEYKMDMIAQAAMRSPGEAFDDNVARRFNAIRGTASSANGVNMDNERKEHHLDEETFLIIVLPEKQPTQDKQPVQQQQQPQPQQNPDKQEIKKEDTSKVKLAGFLDSTAENLKEAKEDIGEVVASAKKTKSKIDKALSSFTEARKKSAISRYIKEKVKEAVDNWAEGDNKEKDDTSSTKGR